MRLMTTGAQLWIGLVLACGGVALGAAVAGSSEATREASSPTLWFFLVAASIAHAFPVIAPRHQAYHATQAFLMAALLLMSWPAVALIILVTNAAEWLRRRR